MTSDEVDQKVDEAMDLRALRAALHASLRLLGAEPGEAQEAVRRVMRGLLLGDGLRAPGILTARALDHLLEVIDARALEWDQAADAALREVERIDAVTASRPQAMGRHNVAVATAKMQRERRASLSNARVRYGQLLEEGRSA